MANIGTTLRAARVNRGLSIEQAAQDTRISRKFLEAIEAEDFGALPAPVYVRGFLRSYSNYLKVDPAPLLEQVASVLDAPASGPDDFVGGPKSRKGQAPPPAAPVGRGPADPWRRRGVAPQPPGSADAEDDGYDAGPPQNIRLRESRGDVGGTVRPRGVVPNPTGESLDQPSRREPLAPLPPPPRPSFPVRSRVEPPPPPPVYPDEDFDDGIEDEYYEEDDQGGVTQPYIPPLYDDPGPIREGATGRRGPGDMREREDQRGGIPPIFIAIAGGIVLLGLFAAAAFVVFGGDDDDGDTPAGGAATNTPTVAISETIAAGTPRPTSTASPSASVSASPSASATGTRTRTATGTPGATRTPGATNTPVATSTPDDSTPTATATATAEATATETATPEPTATPVPPTATSVPATATPVIPTPIPTVEIIPHALGWGECAGGNCGDPPLLVICAPDGWFVDVGRDFANPGWPTFDVLRASDASGVC